jgi:tRNA (uracil-5-)-methyltransferase TRM9
MSNYKIDKIFADLEAGYDRMAKKFSETRRFFWRDLEFIADYINDGDKILDYGCGNGRLLEILNEKKINYAGVDISGKLIKLAKQKYQDKDIKFIKITSSRSLTFPDNYFNVVVSIAVFHHFPENYAKKMAEELHRTLKPGGKIIITVWNLEQERFKKFIKQGKKDLHIPFKDNDSKVFNRYHRLYTKKDLEEMFSEAGFKVEKIELIGGKNILLIGKK